ncbi:hypothetical protein [Frankia sp. Cj5]|uniref:hypothetical protein n=1 Tax=Frankia sp. Cj5 TaxID=2880978 RepID=UPI001EF71844|nr:hypothetical protein [Frankia sp. Cj5]
MIDEFSARCGDLLTGSYDCVDRIVLNAYYPLGHNPGGFRTWWRRLHGGSDELLDNTRLMRMAGRFSRRVRAWAGANHVPVIDCSRGERKHRIAEDYLATNTVTTGVFLILVAKAAASVWDVRRSSAGTIVNIAKKQAYVNHYSFHIMDPQWGHLTITMSGHPPFGAQVILNGHEYVACQAQAAGLGFTKEGNCFTAVADPHALAQVADALSQHAAIGHLSQACDRWIYTACLCFGLEGDEQARSGFRYNYSIYQVEYSRNVLFRVGGQMDRVFNAVVDRTRSRLDVPMLRTLFGAKKRPGAHGTADLSPRLAVMIEKPRWDLTLFKVHFGLLTLKGYTKGEHVLRFEAITHNTKQLGVGRTIERFPDIVARLAGMVERFTTALDCVDIGFLPDTTLDELPRPSQIGRTRVGGIDLNSPRIRATLSAVLALAAAPTGFTVADVTAKVHAMTGQTDADYTTRQAAYDLRKLRGKDLVVKPGRSRRYQLPPEAARTLAALLTLREQVISPILAGVRSPRPGRKPAHWTRIDRDYETLRIDMQTLFHDLGIATCAGAA